MAEYCKHDERFVDENAPSPQNIFFNTHKVVYCHLARKILAVDAQSGKATSTVGVMIHTQHVLQIESGFQSSLIYSNFPHICPKKAPVMKILLHGEILN